MRRSTLSFLLAACATTPRPPPTPHAQLASLAWLRGRWCGPTEAGVVCEVWRDGPDGGLTGEGTLDVEGGRMRLERLRLEARGDAVYYLATPRGAAETAFRLTRSAADEAVFENPAHDFPQRIAYRRGPGDALVAVIEGGGPRQVFAMTRAAATAREPPTFDATPRRLDATLRCGAPGPRDATADEPEVSLGLNTGGDQLGALAQAGLVLALVARDRVCVAQVASCEDASAGEGAECDGDPVCVRFVGDAVTVERRGAVIFRDRAPAGRFTDHGAFTCAP